MAYYFYNTFERLQRKVNELERELEEAEKKFNFMASTNANKQEVEVLGLEIENLVTKLKYFTEALKRR